MTQHITKTHKMVHITTSLAIILLFAGFMVQAADIFWNTGDGAWDTVTPNWDPAATTFTDGSQDNVTFDDTAGSPPATITVQAGGVTPISTTVNTASSYTFTGGPISGGSLAKSGIGTLTLNADNSYAGGTTIHAGTIAVASDSKLGDSAGNLTFAGSGTLSLTENNTFGRTLDINAGVTATIATSWGTSSWPTLNSKITGAGALVFAGTGWPRIRNADNDWSGGLTILSGGPTFYNSGGFGSPSNTVTLSGGQIRAATNFAVSNTLVLDGGIMNPDGKVLTWNGKVTGGTFMQAGNNSTVILTNTNNDFGGVLFNGSGPKLVISSEANLGTGNISRSQGNPAVLRITGATPGSFSKSVSLGSGYDPTLHGFQFDITDSTATVDWNGAIAGSDPDVGLEKAGAGRLNLNAAGSYSGRTVVAAGSLYVNGAANTGNSYTVESGATLGGNGSITLGSATALFKDGATAAPGASIGTLTFTDGTVDIDGDFVYEFEMDQTGQDLIAAANIDLSGMTSGVLNIFETIDGYARPIAESDTFALFTYTTPPTGFNPSAWTVTLASGERFLVDNAQVLDDGIGSIYVTGLQSIPEPASALLILAGIAGLSFRRRT